MGELRTVVAVSVLAAVCFVAESSAQNLLPAGWTATDIGAAAPAGTAAYTNGIFTVEGGGADIWGTADQFMFLHRQVTGDATIVARVTGIERTHAWSKAGVMIRESLSSGSKHGLALVSAAKGAAFQRRRSTSGSSTNTSTSGVAPLWVKLERRGSTFIASRSVDGVNWTAFASDTISMGATVYVGLAVTSHATSTLATGTFTGVTVDGSLPSGWSAADIGAPAIAGSAAGDASGITVTGAGVDIWDAKDEFTFAYRQVTGDVDVVARVASLRGTHDWSKAGVMVRESLRADAAHASLFATSAHGVAFQRRPAQGMQSLHTSGGSGTAPVWVKLERRGSSVTAFRSSDGSTWTMIDSQTLTLPFSFYVGLAVTSHNASSPATAQFTNIAITAASSETPNQPPTVSLSAPTSGATYVAPATVTITASASDTDGSIARVEFYHGTTLIQTDTTSPYSISWTNVPAGSYSLTAVAVDNAGAITRSAARSISVNNLAALTTALFGPSPDHNTSVTSYRLEIFTAGADPSTASAIAVQNLGKPPIVNGECSADIAVTIDGLPGGDYFAAVSAIASTGTSPRALSAVFRR